MSEPGPAVVLYTINVAFVGLETCKGRDGGFLLTFLKVVSADDRHGFAQGQTGQDTGLIPPLTPTSQAYPNT